MAKHPVVLATYRLSETEVIQMAVPVINSYPDVLDQARAVAVTGVKDMLEISVALAATLPDYDGDE